MIRTALIQRTVVIIAAFVLAATLLPLTQAQDTTPAAAINVTGTVESVNGTTIVVSGVPVDISGANGVVPAVQVGVVVQITGSMNKGTIVATTIVIINPTAAPEATDPPESTPETTATPQPTPQTTPSPAPPPTTGDDSEVIIIIEGPVQKITVNVITVLDIDVEVQPGDPILTKVHVGDKIRVEGKAKARGTTIIIVAVNITIINVIIVNPPPQGNPGLPPGCKISKKGKIKCDKKPHDD